MCNKGLDIQCERCGLCCDGYTFWTDNDYDEFKKTLEILAKDQSSIIFIMPNRSFDNDTKEIKKLMEYHNITPLRDKNGNIAISINTKTMQVIKNKEGKLGVHIPGSCNYLEWVDKKAVCKIHERRPIVCKEYYCQKIIDKAVQKLADGIHI